MSREDEYDFLFKGRKIPKIKADVVVLIGDSGVGMTLG